jgi:hypothetical protein
MFSFRKSTGNGLKNAVRETLGNEMSEHVNQITVTYLVSPRNASSVRSSILRKAVGELLKQPEKVMFPKGDSR